MTSYAETLDYLFGQLPMFTRIGAAAIKNSLDNTIALCDLLSDPHKNFRSVHIAGTNGKGSTSHMLAAILQTAGYKTGLYTSPHLKDFRERVRVNGQMITEQTVVDFVEKYKPDFERIQPSFFEMTVALAFDVFAKEQVDIAIIEVGLGGRLDSTNVITPLLSLITNIGWDHMNILGNTLPEIAGEKAGIIKPNIPVIISERQEAIADVFIKKADEVNASITFASDDWLVKVPDQQDNALIHKTLIAKKGQQVYNLDVDLTGTYQQKNIKGVLEAVEQLRVQGFNITDEHVEQAVKQVKLLTGLHGRWEVLSTSPLTICDTGHNPDGIAEVLKNIEAVTYSQLHFVIGMVNDKDISKVLAMLPQNAIYYFCKPDIPRGLAADELQAKAALYHLTGDTYTSVKAALQAAQAAANNNDLVFAGGSTFVVAEIVE